MIYYPLSILMQAGIHEILIISTPEDTPRFQKLLGRGEKIGLILHYAVQEKPKGIAEALLIAKSFFAGKEMALILGDNLFFGDHFSLLLHKVVREFNKGAYLFGYPVKNPSRYGVFGFDEKGKVSSIEEKPKFPKSSYAVAGLYFYDKEAISLAESLTPSQRGELEISDLNALYLQKKRLQVALLGRGSAWLDTGTIDALQQASLFVQTIQERQGIKIACIEEVAYQNGWISLQQLKLLAKQYANDYSEYLKGIVEMEDQKFSKEVVLR